MHRWKFDSGIKKQLRGLGRRLRNFTENLNDDRRYGNNSKS